MSHAQQSQEHPLKLGCSHFLLTTQAATVKYTEICSQEGWYLNPCVFLYFLLGLGSWERALRLLAWKRGNEQLSPHDGDCSVDLNSKHPFEHCTFRSLWIQTQKPDHGNNLEEGLLSVLYSYGRKATKPFYTFFSSRLFYDTTSIVKWEIPLPINVPLAIIGGCSCEVFPPSEWRMSINIYVLCRILPLDSYRQ